MEQPLACDQPVLPPLPPADAGDSRPVWILVAVTLAGFCPFLNLYATQPLLPLFRQLFQASQFAVSLTVSAPVIAIALMAPLAGLLADRVGRKRVIVTALLGLALPTLLTGTARGLEALVFWRFLQGLFVPWVVATTMAYISEESPPGKAGSTMAAYVTGTVIGGFCGRFIAGLAATYWNWPMAFVLLGLTTLAGALGTWWLLPRSRKFVPQPYLGATLRALRGHLGNPQLLACYAVGFDVLFSLVAAFTYINFHLAREPFHLGTAALGSVFFVFLLGVIVTPLAGRLIDRVGNRQALLAALGLSGGGILLTLAPSLPVIIAGLALFSAGVFAGQSATSSYVGRAAGGARSSAAGLYVCLYYAGGTVGGIVPGLFWPDGNWAGCVGLIFAVQLVTAAIAYGVWRK